VVARVELPPAEPHPAYRLGAGDVIEVSYYRRYDVDPGRYLLDVGDRLLVLVEDHPELSTEALIRPDGRMTLVHLGDVEAKGLSPQELTEVVRRSYAERIPLAAVTLLVQEPQAKLNSFMESLMSGDGGTTRALQVRSDGRISLPLLEEMEVSGRTLGELEAELTRSYQELFRYLDVTVNLQRSAWQQIAVLGEVASPGVHRLEGSRSTLQAVASAGGFLPSAKRNSVIVIRVDAKRIASGILVDLKDVTRGGNYAGDLPLQAQDVVFVPRSNIGNVNKFVDLYIRKLLPFNVGVGVFFDVSGND
jgi:polysaccharide export outer membrane protein